MPLPLSPQVFAILSGLVQERTGIRYSLLDRELVADKFSTRAQECGFDSLLDYYYFLRYDESSGPEFEALTESLVVGETYFFREVDQIELAIDSFLAPKIAEGLRPRVWSAACATGEEPLTLAILLAQRRILGQTDIVATDISARALQKALSGRFGRRSWRQAGEPREVSRWLEKDGEQWVVDPNLVAAIDWRLLNLVDRPAVRAMGPFDVVFCRNVFIYFDDDGVRRTVKDLASTLHEGGVLFVGVSESLMRLETGLHCEERNGVFFYRKRPEP